MMNNDDKDVRLALWQVYAAYNEHAIMLKLGKTTRDYMMANDLSVKKLLQSVMRAVDSFEYFRISQHNHNPHVQGKVFEFLARVPRTSMYVKFTVADRVILNSYHPAAKAVDSTWTRRKAR
jgi:hypothetical protein